MIMTTIEPLKTNGKCQDFCMCMWNGKIEGKKILFWEKVSATFELVSEL